VSTISPLTFTGVSKFSDDFQSILNRAVQIAKIPVTQLQSKDTHLLQQKTLLAGLQSSVASVASSLTALGNVGSTKALAASSSDASIVTASATGATTAASYKINSITSAAAAASERTTAGYADAGSTPVSTSGKVTLKIGSTERTLTLINNNLTSVRDQIN